MLRGIAADLPSHADLVDLCNQLPDLMGKVFYCFCYNYTTRLSSSFDGAIASPDNYKYNHF